MIFDSKDFGAGHFEVAFVLRTFFLVNWLGKVQFGKRLAGNFSPEFASLRGINFSEICSLSISSRLSHSRSREWRAASIVPIITSAALRVSFLCLSKPIR